MAKSLTFLKDGVGQEEDSRLAELKLQVAQAGKRAAIENIIAVFKQYADGEGTKRGIRLPAFKEALCAVRPEFHYLSAEEAEQLFLDTDVENDTVLGVTEFSCALSKSFPLEQALSGLPLHRVVESALPGFYSLDSTDHLEAFGNLSDQDIATMVKAISSDLERLLCNMVHELKRAHVFQSQGSCDAGAKFSVTLSGGCISDFHAGLSKRVGGDTSKALYIQMISFALVRYLLTLNLY